MIDEEKAKKEAAAQMTFEQKINLLNDQVFAVKNAVSDGFSTVLLS